MIDLLIRTCRFSIIYFTLGTVGFKFKCYERSSKFWGKHSVLYCTVRNTGLDKSIYRMKWIEFIHDKYNRCMRNLKWSTRKGLMANEYLLHCLSHAPHSKLIQTTYHIFWLISFWSNLHTKPFDKCNPIFVKLILPLIPKRALHETFYSTLTYRLWPLKSDAA